MDFAIFTSKYLVSMEVVSTYNSIPKGNKFSDPQKRKKNTETQFRNFNFKLCQSKEPKINSLKCYLVILIFLNKFLECLLNFVVNYY